MEISATIRHVLEWRGCTQAWVVEQMNRFYPDLKMNRSKFSAIVCGVRKITGDELLAFCKATKTDPDIFLEEMTDEEGA